YHLAGLSSSPNIGQLLAVTSKSGSITNASTSYDNYDGVGRVKTSTHTIAGYPTSPTFTYKYWLNDSLQSLTYPSLRVINYQVDDAGHTINVSTATKTYADLAATPIKPYTPDGRLAQVWLGNGVWETRTYGPPTTPTLIQIGTSAGANDFLKLE